MLPRLVVVGYIQGGPKTSKNTFNYAKIQMSQYMLKPAR